VTGSVESDARWLEVQKIAASNAFNRAPRLSAFLTYICHKTLEGKTDEITEQQIGIHVFGRAADYNPGDDNIVRGAARQLRQKLAVYYQAETCATGYRIDVPKGGYVPVFELLEPAPPALAPPLPKAEPKREPRRFGFPALAAALLAGMCVALVSVRIVSAVDHEKGPAARFWNLVFSSDRNTMIVVGDAGLNIFDNLARREVTLNDYMLGTYLGAPEAATPPGYEWAPLAHRRYTTLADLRVVDQFHRLPQFAGERTSVKFARDIRIEDFKGNNVVIVGSAITNPWSELIEGGLNFHLSYDGSQNTITVKNRHPRGQESPAYTWSERDPTHQGYAHIAMTRNLDGTGHILLVEGTTMAGVNAAADFLTNQNGLAAALAKSAGPAGVIEILLEGRMMDGGSPASRVVAVR